MTCINKQQLQQYIDGECTKDETEQIAQHLSTCPNCVMKQREMEHLALELKQAINLLTTANIEIPLFIIKAKDTHPKPIKYIIYSLSAACIILFFLLFVDKKNQSNQKKIVIVQSIPVEIDANRPATEQDFVIEVCDSKGNRSEFFIE
jgi:hypothetical protein